MNGSCRCLGTFDDLNDAMAAYDNAAFYLAAQLGAPLVRLNWPSHYKTTPPPPSCVTETLLEIARVPSPAKGKTWRPNKPELARRWFFDNYGIPIEGDQWVSLCAYMKGIQ